MPLKRVALALAITLSACGEDASSPYLDFAGGGFIFNYRNAEAFYGFVAKPLRRLPEGAVIEARFDMPGNAAPFVAEARALAT